MVKTKKKRSTSRANNGGMSRPSRGVRGGGLMLDKAAMDHIRLMADPCQGRLVPAAYPTPGGGAIQRFRAVVSVGVGGGGAGFTAGAFSWKPTSNEYVVLNAANGSTPAQPVTASVFPGLSTPGTATSTLTFRCTAACVRAITNASEMNRSGLVYAGQTFQNYLVENSTNTTTVDTVASSLPVSARMPARNIEILWVPTELDQTFNSDSATEILSPGQGATNSAITVAFVGAPGAVGMTFELTAVYEINYNANGNVVAFPSPVTATPWAQVLKAFYTTIRDSPVIIDTVRAGVDYLGLSASSQPGRLVAGVVRRALTY